MSPHVTLGKRKMEFILAKEKSAAIPLILLLIYFSMIPMHLSNHVLCIGRDGHVAFEISANGRCSHAHTFDLEHVDATIAGATHEDDHCGSCIDLAIFVPLSTEAYLVPAQNALMPPAFVVAPLMHEASNSVVLTYTSLLDIPSVIDPVLISLRTTTLLI